MNTLDFTDAQQFAKVLEALLLAAGKPLSLERIAELFDEEARPSQQQIKDALACLSSAVQERAYQLKEVASGFRLQVRAEYSPWIGRLWEERPQRYSRAMLETLALIAYRQPITRGEIEDVRGVAVSTQIIKTLLEREWIRVVGYKDVPGKPAMLATTKTFLDYFNVSGLDQLPSLSELKALQPMADELTAPAESMAVQANIDSTPVEAGNSDEQLSFSSLLAELDNMEQDLTTDFTDPALDEQQSMDADETLTAQALKTDI